MNVKLKKNYSIYIQIKILNTLQEKIRKPREINEPSSGDHTKPSQDPISISSTGQQEIQKPVVMRFDTLCRAGASTGTRKPL